MSTVVTRTTRFCMTKITRGRYKGRTCVYAFPCIEHDIRPMALNLQAQGPDEYPYGFYEEMARQRLRERPAPPKRPRKGSVLR